MFIQLIKFMAKLYYEKTRMFKNDKKRQIKNHFVCRFLHPHLILLIIVSRNFSLKGI